MFKIGDWVTDTFKGKTFQITEDICHTYNHNYVKECIKLWQPKESEWCLFYNEKNSNCFTLARFDKVVEIKHSWDVAYSETLFKSQEYGLQRYRYCEPFIGELPSWIKDK